MLYVSWGQKDADNQLFVFFSPDDIHWNRNQHEWSFVCRSLVNYITTYNAYRVLLNLHRDYGVAHAPFTEKIDLKGHYWFVCDSNLLLHLDTNLVHENSLTLSNNKKRKTESSRYCYCGKHGSFGYTDEYARFCKKHKNDNMEDVKNKRCMFTGCKTRAHFGTDWHKPLYCNEHKKENMEDVMSKRCLFKGCKTIPNFGTEWHKAIYCGEHKKENMENVMTKRCLFNGCKTRPYFGTEWHKPLYCNEHKKENMEDVKNKRCLFIGCKTRATFGTEWHKPLYCDEHKKENMENVVSKRCRFTGCKTHPKFGTEWHNPLYCGEHKRENMEDVVSKRCRFKGCKTQATFGTDWQKPLYCHEHKKDNMENVMNKRCLTALCKTRVTCKYKGYCLFCFIHLFPDEPVSRNYKTKERAVADFIRDHFPTQQWIFDKRISNGTSLRRPDARCENQTDDQLIIVEVDENQHVDYDCTCENRRIMEISQDYGHRSIVFIRFNPDEYTSTAHSISRHVTSCWRMDGKGFCVVSKSKVKEWNERLFALKAQIEYWLQNKNGQDDSSGPTSL